MKPPRLGARHSLYRDPHQEIYSVTADFGEFSKTYYVRDTGRRVGLVVVRNSAVLLVRQYRLLIDALSWEIPGGKVDDGEASGAAAARECLEETGVFCSELTPLVSFEPGLDISHNPTEVFFAAEFTQSGWRADAREVVQVEWIPLERCLQMIFEGGIRDAMTTVGLLAAYYRLNHVREWPNPT